MKNLRRALVVPAVAAVLLAACGDDDTAEPTTAATTNVTPTTAAATTAAATTEAPTTAAPTTAAPTTAAPTTAVPTSVPPTEVPPVEPTLAGEPVEITVNVGVDDATTLGERVETVTMGTDVTLRLYSEQPEEYHVHGFDLEQAVPGGTEASFEFVADRAGRFEVESHDTGRLLLVIEVV
jgi:hypothetical protein